MPISVKDGTNYKLVYEVWQKIADEWVLIPTIHYKIGGAWKLVHSKVTPFVYNKTISVDTYGYNLREAAILAGWNTTDPLHATVSINSGVLLGGASADNFAFSSGLTFPQASKLTINNAGTIVGRGGKGADSGKYAVTTAAFYGGRGGTAVFVNLPTTLNNTGIISAAGGGGGAGQSLANIQLNGTLRGAAGGGGRGSNTSIAGVSESSNNPLGGGYVNNVKQMQSNLVTPSATGGTYTVSGQPSSADFEVRVDGGGVIQSQANSGAGGVGGLLASSGADGGSGLLGGQWTRPYGAGLGGAAGKAIVGKDFITYEVTGTITGVQE